eukprot:12271586-Prorocentrum_lima.AAC.1
MRTGSWVSRTQKTHKLRVLQRAHQLAEAFVDLLKEEDGRCLEAFASAGMRLELTNKAYDDVDVKYGIFMDNPSQQNLDELNKAEETFLSNTEHQACKDYGEKQA